jgi:hypothetical protein
MLQTRAARLTLIALLIAAGVAAAAFAWNAERRVQSIERERTAVDATTDRLLRAVASIAAAQQAYADHGQRDEASFTRVSGLLEEITVDAAELQRTAKAALSAVALRDFATALAAVRDADERAKASLMAGESLAAADALLDLARDPVETMGRSLRLVRNEESIHASTARATLTQRSWLTIAAVALIWVVGLFVLTPLPAPRVTSDAVPPAVPDAIVAEPPPLSPVDLTAVATLCAEISRLTSTANLPDLLRRAAAILDARGIVIWMGAGDELFAATASGYDPAVVSRLRPISRAADNATAAAWRTGEMRTVAANGNGHGAIVAPIAGPAGPVGVIAAEVRHRREDDAATRAAAAIIASQLATVLSAWPAASTADDAASDADRDASVGRSDRQAAAS